MSRRAGTGACLCTEHCVHASYLYLLPCQRMTNASYDSSTRKIWHRSLIRCDVLMGRSTWYHFTKCDKPLWLHTARRQPWCSNTSSRNSYVCVPDVVVAKMRNTNNFAPKSVKFRTRWIRKRSVGTRQTPVAVRGSTLQTTQHWQVDASNARIECNDLSLLVSDQRKTLALKSFPFSYSGSCKREG